MAQQQTETIVALFDGQNRARTIYPEMKARLGPGSMTVSMDEQGRIRMQGSMVILAATAGGIIIGLIVGAVLGLIFGGFSGMFVGGVIGAIIGGILFRWLTPKAIRDTGAAVNPNDTSSRSGQYNQALNEMLSPGKSAVLAMVEPHRVDDVIASLQKYDPERIARGTGSDFSDVMLSAAHEETSDFADQVAEDDESTTVEEVTDSE